MSESVGLALRARLGLARVLKKRLERLIAWVFPRQRDLRVFRLLSGESSRPDDVYVATYPKSGTTWMQMILYQLTTAGDMDFLHISEKSPNVEELFMEYGGDFAALPSPRILKTHLSYEKAPKGRGKYVYVVRNGMSVAVSYYHHHLLYGMFQDSFDAFFDLFLQGRVGFGSWFEHVGGWVENKAGLDLLVVKYEDLHRDLRGSIMKVADFCGLEVREQDWPRILERCSFAFMRRHEAMFDLARGWVAEHKMTINSLLVESRPGLGESLLDARQRRRLAQQLDRRLAGVERVRGAEGTQA